MLKKDFVVIGKITGIHGLKGTLKFYSFSGSADSLKPGTEVILKKKAEESTYIVSSVSEQKKSFLLCLEGFNTIESVEHLTDSEILIEGKSLPELPEGTYYWKDLIGLKVYSVNGESYGVIKTLMETGSNDVFVVRDSKKEILIPFLDHVVKDIDLVNKKVTVDLPEGLIDD